ncbi:MAG: UDP-N-acetylmuramate dehydrogenase [Lachnospiraceae bacterium]|nr:UDP-N-acetylmuramate dehydrogenase [Lachnospiraceae bacterium]
MNQEFLKKLTDAAGEGNVLIDEPMYKHITFRVGGKASYFVEPENVEGVCKVIKLLKKENKPFFVMGNGSNLLVTDEGYDGVIVKLGSKLSNIVVSGNKLTVEAGAMLTRASRLACDRGLTGMERLSGIPGTIGGAVVMNAGAYGAEIKDVIVSAKVLDVETGDILILSREELNLSYRHSIIMEKNYIVLEAQFLLAEGDKDEIINIVNECTAQRKSKQPLEYGSAGSTFKRPEGHFAGKLIQDAGLAGYTVGGAQVSEKHCGFVINRDNATATDVLSVINHVQERVLEQFGVKLELEVYILKV